MRYITVTATFRTDVTDEGPETVNNMMDDLKSGAVDFDDGNGSDYEVLFLTAVLDAVSTPEQTVIYNGKD